MRSGMRLLLLLCLLAALSYGLSRLITATIPQGLERLTSAQVSQHLLSLSLPESKLALLQRAGLPQVLYQDDKLASYGLSPAERRSIRAWLREQTGLPTPFDLIHNSSRSLLQLRAELDGELDFALVSLALAPQASLAALALYRPDAVDFVWGHSAKVTAGPAAVAGKSKLLPVVVGGEAAGRQEGQQSLQQSFLQLSLHGLTAPLFRPVSYAAHFMRYSLLIPGIVSLLLAAYQVAHVLLIGRGLLHFFTGSPSKQMRRWMAQLLVQLTVCCWLLTAAFASRRSIHDTAAATAAQSALEQSKDTAKAAAALLRPTAADSLQEKVRFFAALALLLLAPLLVFLAAWGLSWYARFLQVQEGRKGKEAQEAQEGKAEGEGDGSGVGPNKVVTRTGKPDALSNSSSNSSRASSSEGDSAGKAGKPAPSTEDTPFSRFKLAVLQHPWTVSAACIAISLLDCYWPGYEESLALEAARYARLEGGSTAVKAMLMLGLQWPAKIFPRGLQLEEYEYEKEEEDEETEKEGKEAACSHSHSHSHTPSDGHSHNSSRLRRRPQIAGASGQESSGSSNSSSSSSSSSSLAVWESQAMQRGAELAAQQELEGDGLHKRR